jgi:hypothetical protein
MDSDWLSGPQPSEQVKHLGLIHPFPFADLPKTLEVCLNLVGRNTWAPEATGAFRLFDGFDVGGIEGSEMGDGSPLFIAHFDRLTGFQSDPRLFGSQYNMLHDRVGLLLQIVYLQHRPVTRLPKPVRRAAFPRIRLRGDAAESRTLI